MTLSLVFLSSITLASNNLPDLGSPGLVKYDAITEKQLGDAFTNALHQEFDLVQDLEILSYVRRIGHLVAAQTLDNRHFQFYVINQDSINAFAGPNGIIGIHSGLILAADNEDELASVIAHEIAHVTQQHLARRFEYQDSSNIASLATLLAAILIGTQNPSAGMAAMMGGTGFNLQQQLKYSRIHEHEADYHGIELLQKAGYNPSAMAGFFGKLAKQYQLYEFRPPEILLTHPVSETRLAQAQDRAHQLPSTPSKRSLDFELIKIKLQNAKSNSTRDYATYPFDPDTLQCYRFLLDQPQQSADCLNHALTKHPNNRILRTLKAERMFDQQPKVAINLMKTTLEIYPQDPSILMALAKMLEKSQQAQPATELMETHIENQRYQYEPLIYLAQLYSAQGQVTKSFIQQAKANLVIGNLPRAQHHLTQAKEHLSKHDVNSLKEIEKLKQTIADLTEKPKAS